MKFIESFVLLLIAFIIWFGVGLPQYKIYQERQECIESLLI